MPRPRRESRYAARASAVAAHAGGSGRNGRARREGSLVMAAGFPQVRPRRLRRTAAMRRLVTQTSVRAADLVQPLFVKEGISEPQPVASMPRVMQHTRDSL